MADLKTNYKDDVLDTSKNTKRRYNTIQNSDGTISLEDVTEYLQNGDDFGAADINATNAKVNEVNTNLTANVLHNEGAVNLCNYTAEAPFILPYDGYVGVKCSKGAAQYATLYIETNIADGVIAVRSQGDNSNADFNAIWVKRGMKVYGVVSNTTYGAVTYVPVRSE